MSLWTSTIDALPPVNEDVLILFKHRDDELMEDSLYYAVAHRLQSREFGLERWSYYAEYQGYYEVVYWAPLPDKPRIPD